MSDRSSLGRTLLWLLFGALLLVAAFLAGRGRLSLDRLSGVSVLVGVDRAASEGSGELPAVGGEHLALSEDLLEGGGAPVFYGFCPTEGAQVRRPSLAVVVNERVAELIDRANAIRSRAVSDELRQGLRGLSSSEQGARSAEATLGHLRRAPDHIDADFDFAAAAALLFGVRALEAGQLDEADRWAREAARDAPADPAPRVLEAIAAGRRADEPAARAALRRAFDLDPTDPGVALATGEAFRHTDQVELARRALSAYLEEGPADAMISGLEARLAIRAELLQDFSRRQRRGVTLRFSPELDEELAAEALEAVISALERSAALMGVERRSELLVIVYVARADVLASTCVQGWARAVFDGVLHLDGEGLGEAGQMTTHIDHETLHAQLRAAAPTAPTWFHEGLAQHFAEQRSARHLRSYRMMVDHETWVPFSSLNGTFQVISDSDDAGFAYHQSLAMVELLIHRGGPRVIADAVAYLRQGGDPEALLEHLGRPSPITGRDLLEYLEGQLEAEGRAR